MFRLNCLVLGVLFSASAEKRYQKRQPQGTLLRKGSLRILPKRRGIFAFDAKMLIPIEVYWNPPVFGRSRTKTGGFVRFGFPSVELSWVSVTWMGLFVTDRGNLVGDVWGLTRLTDRQTLTD